MDIPRPSNARRKRIRRIVYGAIALLAVLLITLGLSRLKPAAPGVERATLWIDTVRRGPLLLEVRGSGSLVPEDIRWIPATTQGRVDRILLHPGTPVTAHSVILQLVNPQLDQELQDAELKVQAAEAGLQSLRVQAQNDYLQQKAIAAGTNLARVANPARLKAEVKIAETQAKDIQIGQPATIDTRNGLVTGIVTRIDPSVQNGTITVEVGLAGDLPKGAVPDLTVDGTIELEKMLDVVYVGRPALAQEHSTVALFKLQADGSATRVPVKIGRMSVNAVEVLSGLDVGDQVVLSVMSQWVAFYSVRLQLEAVG